MTAEDPIYASLERLAEQHDDVTALLHERFAARAPESAALMTHMDEHMLGRMMSDLLILVMTEPGDIDNGYLGFEVQSHRAYGVTPEMFPPLLEVVRDAAREASGAAWDADTDAAWQRRLEDICAAIDRVAVHA
ncbi:MAG: hypothetical protein GVY21_05835 [Gammaproteobacteria bacterium]|jgi:hypothetical protein|nr:hypothetical protein [Gammaproteobacteria bacterium]